MILGALLQGIAVEGRAYAGGWLDWLSPYSLLTGAGVVVGYTLLGSGFLAMKVTGEAEDHAYRLAIRAGLATLLLMAAVSLATPFLASQYWDRWFPMPNLLFVSQVPLLTAICFFALLRSIRKRRPLPALPDGAGPVRARHGGPRGQHVALSSSPTASPSGMRQRRSAARSSCWSAWRSSCR